jgi:hypothetical protein
MILVRALVDVKPETSTYLGTTSYIIITSTLLRTSSNTILYLTDYVETL